MQRIKTKLSQEVDLIENEEKTTTEFKSELDLLIQEKTTLLEELRQIDSDILMVNTHLISIDKVLFFLKNLEIYLESYDQKTVKLF